ncbi:hypothetical protein GN958_ATG02070 [Phytophthora infestans]|uniref:BZIP domain-containing protein n=1 Tax=Phytophthora infestans TaxID=4787 RepID=A0A8S9VBC6_PHYIN|nr:hypothetical protein GN958_ATG02070 [Phytophthora infestans]
MSNSVLCPPNKHLLSDGVIRELEQLSRDIATSSWPEQQQDRPQRSSHFPMQLSTNRHSFPARTPDTVSLEGKRARFEQPECLDMELEESDRINHRKKIRAIGTTEQQAKILELLKLGRDSERKRRRDNQRRYRKKQQDVIDGLEVSSERLRDEIHQLQQRRSYVSTNGSVWDVAIHYFRVCHLSLCLGERQLSSLESSQLSYLLHFMQTTMAADVVYNADHGTKAILSNWSILQWFDGVMIEVEGLERNGRETLVARTTTRVTICFLTVERGTMTPLANKLLNKRFVLRGSTRFEWDSRRSCVTNMASQSDFLTPMLQLLGSLELVAQVFEQSLVTPDLQHR